MKVLLDACGLIALGNGTFSPRAAREISRAEEILVSTVSPGEIAVKAANGKRTVGEPVLSWFQGLAEKYDPNILRFDVEIACAAAALPPIHRDPIDRVLIATAGERSLTIVTSDRIIATYPGIRTLW
jgi:PIN domain nuclease of toxin-antitoxin system